MKIKKDQRGKKSMSSYRTGIKLTPKKKRRKGR